MTSHQPFSRVLLCAAMAACGNCANIAPLTKIRLEPAASAAVVATSPSGVLVATITHVFVPPTDLVQGPDVESPLVVGLILANNGQRSLSVAIEDVRLLAQRGGQDAAGSPAAPTGSGRGEPGEWAKTGELALDQIQLAAGTTLTLWLAFSGIEYEENGAKYRLELRLPIDGGDDLAVVLADPTAATPVWHTESLGELTIGTGHMFLSGSRDWFGWKIFPFGSSSNLGRFAQRFTCSPVLLSAQGTSDVGFGMAISSDIAYPIARRMRGRYLSVGPYFGPEVLAGTADTGAPNGSRDTSPFWATGIGAGLAIFVDVDRPFLGPYPLAPQRSTHGRTLAIHLGYLHLWGSLPGATSLSNSGVGGVQLWLAIPLGSPN